MARAKQLFSDKVGSQRDVDDAIARLDIAQEAVDAAKRRKEQLDRLTLDAESIEVTDVPVLAPHEGILRNVTSAVGQVVSLGAPLFEVVELETMWVRAAVYPGLSQTVDHDRAQAFASWGRTSRR